MVFPTDDALKKIGFFTVNANFKKVDKTNSELGYYFDSIFSYI